LPDGYLKDVSFNDDGTTFFLMHRHIDYWNWGGDEVNFIGKDYDVTFNLPAVPPGDYELRLGCAPMDNNTQTRGVAQFYVDGIPQGIPKDLREVGNYASVGGVYPSSGNLRGEELEANIKLLKNNGYYRGPMSIFCGGGDSASPPNQNPNNGTSFIDIPNTMRMKIADVKIEPGKTHKVRVRSVLDVAQSVFMLDYLELVPLSICGIGGTGEDYY
jgi:hypothetical protein